MMAPRANGAFEQCETTQRGGIVSASAKAKVHKAPSAQGTGKSHEKEWQR